jgi:outer membrane protein OmpA-like peptidoglycan-associated protein
MRGNWEIVEWEGRRLLRNTGPRHAAVKILLPHELPESFTIELDAHFTHGNHRMIVATTPPKPGANWSSLEGNFFQIGVAHGTGVATRVRGGIESTNRSVEVENGVVPIRIMVDGRYAKVYVQERRVANIPNAEFRRSAEIYIENIYSGSEENPLYLGPIRIAEGGRDLYDKLAEDGRVATQGILFAVNSSEIRPESTPTLEEIGTMLQEHEDLRIRIEGHTDATGDDASNQTLSEERAERHTRGTTEQPAGRTDQVVGGAVTEGGNGASRSGAPFVVSATPTPPVSPRSRGRSTPPETRHRADHEQPAGPVGQRSRPPGYGPGHAQQRQRVIHLVPGRGLESRQGIR